MQWLKNKIKLLPFQFTKNQKYDAQTKKILQKICTANSNCVDVGCHKGEVFDLFIKYAPNGTHFGFEPIPNLFQQLIKKYANTPHHLFSIALSNTKSETTFNHVVTNPAYSGLKAREYNVAKETTETITVDTDLLDNVLKATKKIHVIKIDVEGGELLVLEGATQILKTHQPIVIFEHGLGASEYYNSTPEKIFTLLHECGMQLNTMQGWLRTKPAFTELEFCNQFYKRLNYYFIAYPTKM